MRLKGATYEDIAKAVASGKGKKEDFPRLLAVDNEVVVPVNKVVVVQVTAADVIHAFSVQSFGVKVDAVPGRLNQTWFKATREGVFYGQCNQICGVNHAFMPIAVEAVDKPTFDRWAAEAKKRFAANGSPEDIDGTETLATIEPGDTRTSLGLPEVVRDGETGVLRDVGDVDAMAAGGIDLGALVALAERLRVLGGTAQPAGLAFDAEEAFASIRDAAIEARLARARAAAALLRANAQ